MLLDNYMYFVVNKSYIASQYIVNWLQEWNKIVTKI